MAQEREIATRIASLDDLAEIVAGIRAIAATQMQQALKSLEAIRSYSELINEALSDAASLLHRDESVPSQDGKAGLVLFGAEHGLCGGFNQELLRVAEDKFAQKNQKPVLILVGSRAAQLCRERGLRVALALPMATHCGGVTGTARRVAAELYRMFTERDIAGVEVFHVGQSGGQAFNIVQRRLLPFDLRGGEGRFLQLPPLINVPPRQLFDDIVAEYFFAALENAAMQSFFSENSTRFRTMEAAHQNIKKKSAELTKVVRRMRQETITSEILELISGAEALGNLT